MREFYRGKNSNKYLSIDCFDVLSLGGQKADVETSAVVVLAKIIEACVQIVQRYWPSSEPMTNVHVCAVQYNSIRPTCHHYVSF